MPALRDIRYGPVTVTDTIVQSQQNDLIFQRVNAALRALSAGENEALEGGVSAVTQRATEALRLGLTTGLTTAETE